jgi:tetratricopeptide (TPR) repeat protein
MGTSFRALVLVGLIPALIAPTLAYAQDKQDDVLDKKDKRVEPTHWGDVYGRVYDATTGEPIKDAKIVIEDEEGFADEGKTVGMTDELGGYKARAILGRISSNFDLGRALLTSPLLALFGAANNTTKRVDVSQICVRVSSPGYKDFEGVVAARSVNASKFRIDMEPILLVRSSSGGVSVSAVAWSAVRINDVSAEPPTASKGQQVKLRAQVTVFGKSPSKNIEIVAFSALWKGEKKLKLAKDQPVGGPYVFETDYKVSGREKSRVERVYFAIKKSVLDFDPNNAFRYALVQIVVGDEDIVQAGERTLALQDFRQRRNSDSKSKFASLSARSGAAYDLEMLAFSAENTSDWRTASEAWSKLASVRGDDFAYESELLRALYRDARYTSVIERVAPILKKTKPKDWYKKVRTADAGHLGLSYLKMGMLEEAQHLNLGLLDWPTSGLNETVIEFRGSLRLAEVDRDHKADPGSANALADYGRAYLDLGRFEEAVAKLRASLDLDPAQQAVKRDMIWAALQLTEVQTAELSLDEAVESARAELNIGDDKQRSKSFFAWNKYGVLLYALSERQRKNKDPKYDETLAEAVFALREALSLGRVGAVRDSGVYSYMYGYMSGSQVAISGFAYPQANASFSLLESLKRLKRDPNNSLAVFCKAAALMDLNQLALARGALEECATMRPNDPEVPFLMGLIESKSGDFDAAKTYLESCLKSNPIHPRANLVMANILADEGNVVGAAERLTSHATVYGEQRR